MTHRIAIIGASGYTGAELIRLIATHPNMEIVALAANSKAGQSMAQVFPHLRHLDLPTLVTWEQIDFDAVDLCFCALPHKTSQEVIRELPAHLKIVDLSADFRLSDPEAYSKWYGNPHGAVEMQKEAVYGLTEFYRDAIAKARLVAGTGCNAATGQFILRPLIGGDVIDLDDIILDMKCAVSGAGRSLKENLLHAELSEGTNAYAVGGTHRHLGEFDQEFSALAGRPVRVQFTPHLIPANRGVLATCYVKGDPQMVHSTLKKAYVSEPFIEVLPFGETPSTHHVRGSNFCHIGVTGDRIDGRAIVVAALDNLTKGSSGQALQNANLMLGEQETAGLMLVPCFRDNIRVLGIKSSGQGRRVGMALKSLRKQRRIQVIAVAVVALALSTAMIGYAMRDGINFFRSPSQVAEAPPPPNEVFRIGGLVEIGSLKRGQGEQIRFSVTDGGATVPVVYTGVLPDLFGENEGMVGTGRYVNGVFEATEILAKHDESYMPKEVVDALKAQGVYQEPGS